MNIKSGARPAGGVRAPGSAVLYPPGQPFSGTARPSRLGADLRTLGNQYLESMQSSAGISDEVLEILVKDTRRDFGWLPLTWGAGPLEQSPNPRGSFWVVREAHGVAVDRSVVLLAGYRLAKKVGADGEVGLRVVMHLRLDGGSGDWRVHITGMSSSRLPLTFKTIKPLQPMKLRLQRRLGVLTRTLGHSQFAIDGLSYVDPEADATVRVFVSSAKTALDGDTLRNFRVVADVADDDSEARLRSSDERISHAVAQAFVPDPASCPTPAASERRRPTRKAVVLDPLRIATTRIPWTLQRGASLEVRQTRLGNVSADPANVQVIVPTNLPLRSDDLAAAHAYLRGDELMQRLEVYGLMPHVYFKRVSLPLLLRHRAPLRYARDGISVNAQVRPNRVGPGVFPPTNNGGPPPQAELSFGWACLTHRSRRANDKGRLREQPLGLAADERWAWHEFGHVLNLASFGETEFRFAHSAGDALAAIVADPDSALAWLVPSSKRFLSFPWVFIPRRHDRSALRGWCWCGRRNLSRLAQAVADPPRGPNLGYFEEQLLSTSLFRLYRCIGGESGDLATRRSASDYCVYLVMRAIQFLGSESVVPATQVSALVQALIDADVGTGNWDIAATWPEAATPRLVSRVGGCVHKVIRWAFEQQGWNATQDDSKVVEGPGRPPPVDIYIADRRPGGKGGYEPVSLTEPATPAWHAGPTGIKLETGKVVVTVRNRGDLDAPGVTVQCWALTKDHPTPENPALWTLLSADTAAQTVKPGAAMPFDFGLPSGPATLPPGDYWVKASANCVQDPSNIDPAGAFSLANLAVPLADLVANDNNLGLRVLALP